MKKLFFSAVVLTAISLSSCGGGNDAKADGEKLCKCFKDSATDLSKAEECNKLGEDLEKKYPKESEGYKIIDEIMDKCE